MLLRPTLQARAGFDPTGYGPGISAPYGYSPLYDGHHNGEDWFWLGKESAERLGISTEQSKRVYPVREGYIGHIEDSVLGLGLWQQIDATHRFYWWHLRDREPAGVYGTDNTCGRMGRTGSGAGNDEHLHSEVRRAPYGKSDRINPAPFFATGSLAGGDGTPIELEEDDDMVYAIRNSTPNPAILPLPANAVLIGHGTEPLVWVSNSGPEELNGVKVAEWSAELIVDRINQVGLRGSGKDLNKVYREFPRSGVEPVYVLGAAPASSGPLKVQLTGTATPA